MTEAAALTVVHREVSCVVVGGEEAPVTSQVPTIEVPPEVVEERLAYLLLLLMGPWECK